MKVKFIFWAQKKKVSAFIRRGAQINYLPLLLYSFIKAFSTFLLSMEFCSVWVFTCF